MQDSRKHISRSYLESLIVQKFGNSFWKQLPWSYQENREVSILGVVLDQKILCAVNRRFLVILSSGKHKVTRLKVDQLEK